MWNNKLSFVKTVGLVLSLVFLQSQVMQLHKQAQEFEKTQTTVSDTLINQAELNALQIYFNQRVAVVINELWEKVNNNDSNKITNHKNLK